MTPRQFQLKLKGLKKEFQDLYDKYAPTIAGKTAVRLFKENFQKEGFFGEKWKEVQRREPWSRTYKSLKKRHPADTQRRILTGRTGDLGRSITAKVQKNGTVDIFTNPIKFVESKEPYGRVHNEGLRAGRGSGFIMPQRQFMGDHPTLRKAITEEIERKLTEIKQNNAI